MSRNRRIILTTEFEQNKVPLRNEIFLVMQSLELIKQSLFCAIVTTACLNGMLHRAGNGGKLSNSLLDGMTWFCLALLSFSPFPVQHLIQSRSTAYWEYQYSLHHQFMRPAKYTPSTMTTVTAMHKQKQKYAVLHLQHSPSSSS